MPEECAGTPRGRRAARPAVSRRLPGALRPNYESRFRPVVTVWTWGDMQKLGLPHYRHLVPFVLFYDAGIPGSESQGLTGVRIARDAESARDDVQDLISIGMHLAAVRGIFIHGQNSHRHAIDSLGRARLSFRGSNGKVAVNSE